MRRWGGESMLYCNNCNTLQHTATHYNTLQHTATRCNTLQHTATHCNTLQHNTTGADGAVDPYAEVIESRYTSPPALSTKF